MDWIACGYSRGSITVDPSRRVQLKHGQTSTLLEGRVTSAWPEIFVLGAQEGQIMTVALTSDHAGFELVEPSESGKPGNIWERTSLICPQERMTGTRNTFWKGMLPRSGDYTLTVSTNEADPAAYGLAISFSKPGEASSLTPDEKMKACGSIENGKTIEVKKHDGPCISLPTSLYPKENMQMIFHGAKAHRLAPCPCHVGDCWGSRYGFDGNGFVEISAKSKQASIPDYHLVIKTQGFDAAHLPPVSSEDLEIHVSTKSEPLTKRDKFRISGNGYAKIGSNRYFSWKGNTSPNMEVELPLDSCSDILPKPIPAKKEMIIVGRGSVLYGESAGMPFGKFMLDIVTTCGLSSK